MKVLVACEYSGVVRNAFAKRGHEVLSCDLLPTDKTPIGNSSHHQGDVRSLLNEDWDMIIAHPPCIYLSNAGISWLYKDEARWGELDKAADFFNLFLNHKCEKVVIENPVPHKYAIERFQGVKYNQLIQPYQFGHPESKRTCLWLKGVNPLEHTNNVELAYKALPKTVRQRLGNLGETKDRWKKRSKTFQGVADAMASQWG